MEWITHNLQILATLGSALAVYIGLRHAAKKDVIDLSKRLDKVETDLKDIKDHLTEVETRLTVVETLISIFTGNFKFSQKERTDS